MNESQHIERIEQDDGSSAGWDTQQLAPTVLSQPAAFQPAPSMAHTGNRTNLLGAALIAIGLFIWLGRMLPNEGEITGGMVLLTIASPFLFFAFWKRIYGLLIPGSILAGLSIGVPFASLTNGMSVVWGLSLGFMAIYLLGRELFSVRAPWPIFPAVPLFVVGIIIGVANLPTFFATSLMWLPVLLIGAGLYLGWGRQRP